MHAAHEYFITKIGKKSKTALKNFMEQGGRGIEDRGPTYEAED